jgi:hypothetical protein
MYCDTLVFTSEALRHLAAEVGSSQLVIGTDHPIPWQAKAVDHILEAPGFTDAQRRAMLGETARSYDARSQEALPLRLGGEDGRP